MTRSSSRKRAAAMHTHARLYEILDRDPALALAEARAIRASPDLSEINVKAIRAAIFVDAGSQLGDAAVVAEGVELLRTIDTVTSPQVAYNLANGVAALSALNGAQSLGQLDTAEERQEAKVLFQYAAEKCEDPSIKSSSLTNQANLLKDSYRWVEAYDRYAAALEHDPSNAIALSGIGSLLRWRMKGRTDKEGPLRRAAVRYMLRAHEHKDRAHKYAGPSGVARIEELMREFRITATDKVPRAEARPASPFAEFVRRHRLALCLEPESAGASAGRWDHLAIDSVSESATADWRVPTVFASWNVLKSDFLTARWLAYTASAGDLPVPDTGFYSDTLDYANYGMRSSTLVLAQRAACDVLDKIAVAASDYLQLPGKQIYFGSRWHLCDTKNRWQLAKPLKWQPKIEAEIKAGNSSLIALSELAYDYSRGHLHPKKKARNAATHGLVVLHDMLIDGRSRVSTSIERHREVDFGRVVVESLQIARAALMYFREVVAAREARMHQRRSGIAIPMMVPSHHWVRGEDSGPLSRRPASRNTRGNNRTRAKGHGEPSEPSKDR